VGVSKTPGNSGGSETLTVAGVSKTPGTNGSFENPKYVAFFQGLLKTLGNPLATLVFPGKLQTPGKPICGG